MSAIQHWAESKGLSRLVERDEGDGWLKIDTRRIYILPTRFGLLYAGVLLLMLLGAINYGNSLAFLLTFTLGSIAVVSIFHTFRNLRGVSVRCLSKGEWFAGNHVSVPIELKDSQGLEREALEMVGLSEEPLWLNLDANRQIKAQPSLQSVPRGWYQIPVWTLQTRYPMGLFRAWSRIRLPVKLLVYPHPHGKLPLPGQGGIDPQGSGHLSSEGDEYAGLREYREGDSLNQVHWKSLARNDRMMTKEFEQGEARELWFTWQDPQLGGLSKEARISQLCHWVLLASREDLRFGLSLPGSNLEVDRGMAHRNACLKALALL